eukprot:2644321-Prymnesium_polylepis.1
MVSRNCRWGHRNPSKSVPASLGRIKAAWFQSAQEQVGPAPPRCPLSAPCPSLPKRTTNCSTCLLARVSLEFSRTTPWMDPPP